MNILPKLRTRFGENVGVEIFIVPPYLDDNNKTFIATDAASGVSSFTVDNGLKFAVNDYAVVGALGAEKSEIVRAHASMAPTATVLTLSGATGFAHNRGERVVFIPYNQIKIQRSIDGGATYSDLVTIGIRADSTETFYAHTAGASTDYYRAKFYNSGTTLESQVSDGIIATGYADNSVGRVVRSALVSLGEEVDAVITKEFLYEALNEGRTDVDTAIGVERWSFRTAFDYNAGTVIPGMYRLALPSNFREPATNKNLLSVRIGKEKLALNYVDKQSLNRWYLGVARSTLNGAITTGSTSIVLTESGDFNESGTIYIAGEAASDIVDVVAYTANDEVAKTLSGVTGIQAAGHGSGAVVWQGAAYGYPTEYTVDSGYIIFSQPFDDGRAGKAIWLDYYTKLSDINSDGDTLDEPNYKMYVAYLRWRIKKRRNKELKAEEDDDYKDFFRKMGEAIKKEYSGQDSRMIPDVPC